uniref:Gem-associated protein 2 n=1 Tax=Parastrongyloides trichosuri TaxID=131310 RepID=A0A0N4ZA73_PARTI
MDQRPFIELSKFDKTTVDLKKPPHTAEEYLRQAIVERESIPQVVRYNIDKKNIQKVEISYFKQSNDVPSFNYMKSKEWTEGQIKLFMSQRVIFLQYIPERENLDDDSCNSSISLPKSYDEWINFCINNTTSSIELPSPSLLKEMNAKNLSDCIGSLTQACFNLLK